MTPTASMTDPFVALSFVAAALAVLLSAFALRHRETPGADAFAAFAFGIALWTASTGLSVASEGVARFVFWTNVEWIGILLVSVSWVRFSLEYVETDESFVGRFAGGLTAPAIPILVGIWTNPLHGLFRSTNGEAVAVAGSVVAFAFDHGPLYLLTVGYVTLLLFVGTVVLVRPLFTTTRAAPRRNTVVLVAVVVPWSTAVIDIGGYGPIRGVDLVPLALTVSCLAFGWLLFAGNLFDSLPLTPTVSHGVVFSELADGVVVLDTDDRIVDCNRAARALVPSAGSPVGEPIDAAFPAIAGALREGRSTDTTHVVLDDGTRERYFEVRSTRIERDGPRPLGRLVTIHDIDERVLREQRLDVLNRVLRHNVRNQMTVVLGRNENLLEGLTDEELIRQAETVDRAGRRLLDWADRAHRIEQTVGQESIERERIDLSATVEPLVDRLRSRYPAASMVTRLDEAAVLADSSIVEAVEELLVNAVEHSDRPEPTVRVTVAAEGESVELRVADDGPGIPPIEQQVLDRGRETPLDHASGLGLWYVSWLVRRSGGTISFEENEPRGSVVILRFPAPSFGDRRRSDAGKNGT